MKVQCDLGRVGAGLALSSREWGRGVQGPVVGRRLLVLSLVLVRAGTGSGGLVVRLGSWSARPGSRGLVWPPLFLRLLLPKNRLTRERGAFGCFTGGVHCVAPYRQCKRV